MSSERLRVKLLRGGMDEDKAMEMDRSKLLEMVAITMISEQLMEATQVPLLTDETGSVAFEVGSVALRMKELGAKEKRGKEGRMRASERVETNGT